MSDQQNWQQQAWQQPQQQAAPQYQPQPGVGQQAYYAQPQPVYVQPQQKAGKGWIVALVGVLAIFLLLAIGMVSCSGMVSSALGTSMTSGYDASAYITEDTVAIIELDGTIQYDGTTCSPEGLKEQLDNAEENPAIKAVVLRVNSGGGTATAGEEMASYIKDFSKPIVVSSASMNASAAYEISSQADYIYTAKTTSIGSIGTALSITDLSGLYEKLGIRIDDITSSDSKDSSYGNRALTDEEREYYQQMVNDINETFIQTVAEGRAMDVEKVRELATGLTFTGMTAIENGLADEIGTLEDACDKAAELAHISSYETAYLYSNTSVSMYDLLDILGKASSKEELLKQLEELESDGSFAN